MDYMSVYIAVVVSTVQCAHMKEVHSKFQTQTQTKKTNILIKSGLCAKIRLNAVQFGDRAPSQIANSIEVYMCVSKKFIIQFVSCRFKEIKCTEHKCLFLCIRIRIDANRIENYAILHSRNNKKKANQFNRKILLFTLKKLVFDCT